ncbi:DUF7519 family protein [Haloarcula litorea]|uniref:DUF7519 family protein n=1 Tax=Haloarcula litorea TaxID=3032579 RepID=UPI0023E8B3D1|nr:hypothetical protein [Halomicroarcula sp. GDY20]
MSTDTRPARATATLAGAVAVVTALLVGFGVAGPVPVVGAVAGGLSVAAGAWLLDGATNARLAGGSVTLVAGVVAVGTAPLLATGAGTAVALALGLGVTAVATDLVVGVDGYGSLHRGLVESGNVVLVGLVAAVGLTIAVRFGVVTAVLLVPLAASVVNPLVGFVTLQAYALAVLALLHRAGDTVAGWLPDREGRRLDRLTDLGVPVREVPRAVWAVLGVECLLALSGRAVALFSLFVDAVPGGLLGAALSGPLHAVLGLVGLALLGVLAADALHNWVADWLGDDPPRALSFQAGGLVAVALALTVVPVLSALGLPFVGGVPGPSGTVAGPAGVALGAVLLCLVTVGIGLRAISVVAGRGLVARGAAGVAVGSGLLLVGTLGAAELGLWTPLVVVGVAGALLAWDVGSHAASVGAQLGRAAETTDAQFVHVTGSILVVLAGVGIALAGRYLVVPAVAPPATADTALRAGVALGLAVVALVAFAIAGSLRDRRTVEE